MRRMLVGILATLAIVAAAFVTPALAGVVILLMALLSKTPFSELGFKRPHASTLAVAALAGVLFKLLLKSIVMPLLGAPAINPAYHWLAGNTAALPGMIGAVVVGAGFGEETFFRSWLFERLRKLKLPIALIVALTSA